MEDIEILNEIFKECKRINNVAIRIDFNENYEGGWIDIYTERDGKIIEFARDAHRPSDGSMMFVKATKENLQVTLENLRKEV